MVHLPKSLIFAASLLQLSLSAVVRQAPIHNITSNHYKRANSYKLVDKFAGESFFDGWDFWDKPDPTHGQINYLSRSDAMNKNLTFVQPDGTVVLAVDDYTWLNEGEQRNSIRIQSKKSYNGGLFILDAWSKSYILLLWPINSKYHNSNASWMFGLACMVDRRT
jgi:hypothetical protein